MAKKVNLRNVGNIIRVLDHFNDKIVALLTNSVQRPRISKCCNAKVFIGFNTGSTYALDEDGQPIYYEEYPWGDGDFEDDGYCEECGEQV